ncbi:unnamed protein product [Pedinophyceae sp. YPF-701]|nr:unnamed protein product [Pedinophyceae sp. YPF-701]
MSVRFPAALPEPNAVDGPSTQAPSPEMSFSGGAGIGDGPKPEKRESTNPVEREASGRAGAPGQAGDSAREQPTRSFTKEKSRGRDNDTFQDLIAQATAYAVFASAKWLSKRSRACKTASPSPGKTASVSPEAFLRELFPNRPRVAVERLSQHERELVVRGAVKKLGANSFAAIGGLTEIKTVIHEEVIEPLTQPHVFRTPNMRAPHGLLLYGPPGTGKEMLAKAVAQSAGLAFVRLKASSLLDKYYGETNKYLHAYFSLARKLEPSMLFIDEAEAVLGARRDQEHEVSGSYKAELMQLWDELESEGAAVLVLGATNLPDSLDDAAVRRFTVRLEVPLPDAADRAQIVRLRLFMDHVCRMHSLLEQSQDFLSNREVLATRDKLQRYLRGDEARGDDIQNIDRDTGQLDLVGAVSPRLWKAVPELVRSLEGWTGCDLKDAMKRAFLLAHHESRCAERPTGQTPLHGVLKRQWPCVQVEHFEQALAETRPAREGLGEFLDRRRGAAGRRDVVRSKDWAGHLRRQLINMAIVMIGTVLFVETAVKSARYLVAFWSQVSSAFELWRSAFMDKSSP